MKSFLIKFDRNDYAMIDARSHIDAWDAFKRAHPGATIHALTFMGHHSIGSN